jgi:hypothetical protein
MACGIDVFQVDVRILRRNLVTSNEKESEREIISERRSKSSPRVD